MATLQDAGDVVSIAESARGLFGGSKTASSSLTKNWAREDTAIQRRVADAKNAGIHPLFALGASVSQTQGAFPPSGSNIGTALKRISDRKSSAERGVKSSLVDEALIEQAMANARNADARTANEEWQLQNSIDKRNEGNANIIQDPIATMDPEPTRSNPSSSKFVGPLRPRLTILEDGTIIRMNPLTSTGQELEDTHGEVMGNVYGIYNEAVRGKRAAENAFRKKIIRAQKLNKRMYQYGDQRR